MAEGMLLHALASVAHDAIADRATQLRQKAFISLDKETVVPTRLLLSLLQDLDGHPWRSFSQGAALMIEGGREGDH